MESRTGIVYVITNITNNKKYVSQTAYSIEQGWLQHISSSQKPDKSTKSPLYQAMITESINNFKITMLEIVPIELLNETQSKYIKLLNTLIPHGYNKTMFCSVWRNNVNEKKPCSDSIPPILTGQIPPLDTAKKWYLAIILLQFHHLTPKKVNHLLNK
jgi:group I intron endonuclease